MDKKIIGALLCVCIFSIGSIPVTGESPIDELDFDQEIKSYIEQLLDIENQSIGNYFFLINGPVLKTYSNVELLNGSEFQIEKINRYLNWKLFRPVIFLKYTPVFTENLSFTLDYKKNVRTNSRYSYVTLSATVIFNETSKEYEGIKDINHFINQVHKINIVNMTGIFIFQRIKLFDRTAPLFRKIFQPAKFLFIGFCDNIDYLES